MRHVRKPVIDLIDPESFAQSLPKSEQFVQKKSPWGMILGGIVLLTLALSVGWFMRGNTNNTVNTTQTLHAEKTAATGEQEEVVIEQAIKPESESKPEPVPEPEPEPALESEQESEPKIVPEIKTEVEKIEESVDNSARLLEEKVNQLFIQCETHLAAKRLTSGAGGNALQCFSEILDISPDNSNALDGLSKIQQTYANWASTAIAKQDVDIAQANIDKLQALNDQHPSLADLTEGLTRIRNEIELQAQIKLEQQKKLLADEASWSEASCTSVIQLQNYLQSFPEGLHAAEAKYCINQIEVAELAELEAKRKAEAEKQRLVQLEENQWQGVSCTNRTQLESYLGAYPNGKYKNNADSCLQKIEAKRLADESQRNKDKGFWAQTSCSDKNKLKSYLSSFPQGIYRETAKSCLQDIEYQERFVFGLWRGKGTDVIVPSYDAEINLSKSGSTIHAYYPGGSTCLGDLIPKTPIENLQVGSVMTFTAKLTQGSCLKKAKVKITWLSTNQIKYEWFKLGVRVGSGQLDRSL